VPKLAAVMRAAKISIVTNVMPVKKVTIRRRNFLPKQAKIPTTRTKNALKSAAKNTYSEKRILFLKPELISERLEGTSLETLSTVILDRLSLLTQSKPLS